MISIPLLPSIPSASQGPGDIDPDRILFSPPPTGKLNHEKKPNGRLGGQTPLKIPFAGGTAGEALGVPLATAAHLMLNGVQEFQGFSDSGDHLTNEAEVIFEAAPVASQISQNGRNLNVFYPEASLPSNPNAFDFDRINNQDCASDLASVNGLDSEAAMEAATVEIISAVSLPEGTHHDCHVDTKQNGIRLPAASRARVPSADASADNAGRQQADPMDHSTSSSSFLSVINSSADYSKFNDDSCNKTIQNSNEIILTTTSMIKPSDKNDDDLFFNFLAKKAKKHTNNNAVGVKQSPPSNIDVQNQTNPDENDDTIAASELVANLHSEVKVMNKFFVLCLSVGHCTRIQN